MSLPTLSGVGRLTHDPETRFTSSGMAVTTLRLAFNSRKKDQSGQWVDGEVFYVRAKAFKEMAENIADSLAKGSEVVVSGRLKTESWEDKSDGGKRSAPELLIDSIGPSLRWATASVKKAERSGGGPAPADDPWGSAPNSSRPEEPPF